MDLDNNGRIDDGRELFGEATRMPDGTTTENGYAAFGYIR